MGTIESPLATALFGKTRRAVLALLLMNADRGFYVREIVRAVGAGVGSVQRELASLADAGVVRRRRDGRQVYYQADPACPILPELRAIFAKTVALGDVVRHALEPLRNRIAVALLFGSAARGQLTHGSDVDLLVIGDVPFAVIGDALHPIEGHLAREVNASVFAVNEWAARLAADHHFVSRVADSPKVFLVGDEHELARVGAERVADAPPQQPVGNRGAARRRGARPRRRR